MTATASLLLAANNVSAQTTNALDWASDPAYSGAGEPNGLSSGSRNGGYGFGTWTFSVANSGGAFIAGSGPSGASFDLWNTSGNSATLAVRPFNSPLVVGQSFSAQIRLNSLDGSSNTNALLLQDAGGNTVFSYWHTGFEANANNGHYTDAATTDGAAVGFDYHYQQFCTFTFTLTSPTTYIFTDNTTGHSFSGTISGTIAQAAFFRGNGTAPGNGQDLQFDGLQIVSSAPATFGGQTPAPGAYSGSRTNISVQVTDGSLPINANTILLKVDGSAVTPGSVTKSVNITTITYVPAAPLSAGAVHTVQVSAADNNGSRFTNAWSFTTGFSSLPAVLSGPIATGGGNDVIIFTAAGDSWLGTNYGVSSSRTIYVRQSMVFLDLNGETANDGSGGCFGGLQFFSGGTGSGTGTERLLTGETWRRNTWSVDDKAGGGDLGEVSLNPPTTVVVGEWHTLVTRVDYTPNGNATVTAWLDPDFTQTEGNQAITPFQVTMNNTFDNIRLRCGNGTANAIWTNVIVGALSTDVGFQPSVDPIFQGFVPGVGAPSALVSSPVSVSVVPGSSGIKTSSISLNLDGNAVTPVLSIDTNKIVTVSYQPAASFSAGSSHSVTVSLTDSNGAPYSTNWSFTADAYPALPINLAGPIDVIYGQSGDAGITIFSNLNGWISDNYQSTSTNTLYTRFSMVFFDLNGESADDAGGCYGGLHFFQDGAERLLTGETWLRNTWSVDDKKGGEGGEISLPPVTTVVVGEWHTMVVKSVYAPNTPTAVEVWLDPDFTKTEFNQPQGPVVFSMDNTFNNVRLRCGNGSAAAEFRDITFAATGPGVGFVAPLPPGMMSAQMSGGALNLSWTGAGTLQEAPAITGPWTISANQANPQALATTNSARFYRLSQ